jgi:hypothetical protein
VNDVRFGSYILIDAGRVAESKVPNVVVKYIKANGSNLTDVKLFRTGEMYLIRAEAYAEKNNLPKANDDLNDLRAARITGYVRVAIIDKDIMIDNIISERFKELAFEGHRHFDLRRRNLNISRNPEDAVNALGAVLLKPTDAQYVFPIPNSELRANGNMKPNPGY